ncbi:MAG: hypothetical protein EOP54_06685 [Sphingobacteriales bacterium]|nr:MAG: hypothetical protein EOP54_06685 [Sphingobacteriales bacterium]
MENTTGLIETMYVLDQQIALENYHRKRLQEGLEKYRIKLSAAKIFSEIYKTIERHVQEGPELKVRLEIFPTPAASALQLDVSAFSRKDLKPVTLGFASNLQLNAALSDHLKTTDRDIYDEALSQAGEKGTDDMILFNERGEVVETGIFNILWHDEVLQQWCTPPLSAGCVAGVQRAYLLDSGKLQEKVCYPENLLKAKSIMVCNALRGVLNVAALQY